jgi:hypothetical protein|tara:strand:+ start:885 stop:1085 length:201 start_codon:yes stop_codon:yes gene_type:complete
MSSWWPVPVIAEGALISDLRILEHEAREVLDKILKAIDVVAGASSVIKELEEIERRKDELLASLRA